MSVLIIQEKSIDGLCSRDPIFSQILELHGPPPNYQRAEGFETLVRIILEQQVSLESAYAAYQKLKEKVTFITPKTILSLNDQQFRTSYISRQKTRYLRELATAVNKKTLEIEKLGDYTEATIRRQLTAVKGIGNWTTEVYLMFALQHPDVFPIGDIAAVNAVKSLTGLKTKEEVMKYSISWKPYRTAATFFLWHYYLKERNRKVDHLL